MSQKGLFKVKTSDGKEIELKNINVNSFIRLESNTYYSQAFNEAVDKKMMLRIQMEKLLESQGLLDTKADEAKAANLRKKIKELEIQLRKAVTGNRRMTKEEGRAIALEMRDLRDELGRIGQSLASYFNNTVESYADNERLQYFVYATTVYADTGQRYWKSYEEFKTDVESDVYNQASKAFLTNFMGLSDETDNSAYEVKWLKRMKFMDNQGRLRREDGKLVDETGKLINEEGRFIDEDGNYLDIYGNKVDKDGNLLIKDEWEPVVAETPSKV